MAEGRTAAPGRVEVTRGGEEETPDLLVVLAAVVVGMVLAATDVSTSLAPVGMSYPMGGREVKGNCVGTNNVVTDEDSVGEGRMLLPSACCVRPPGSAVIRAVV